MIGPVLLVILSVPPVVRVTRGPVSSENDVIATGPESFAEVHLPKVARLRLSASTRMVFGDHVRLESGRVWVQVGPEPLEIRTVSHGLEIGARSSVVLERTSIGGTVVTVRAGEATLRRKGEAREIGVGHVLRVLPGDPTIPPPRIGGSGLSELIGGESRRALRDSLGIQAFLLRRAIAIRPGTRRALVADETLRGQSQILGAEAGAAGVLLEEGLRPPPFFEDEVPPKGPNVRVEVEFAD